MMTKNEALKAAIDGEMIINRDWLGEGYFYFDGCRFTHTDGNVLAIDSFLPTSEWEIYKQPQSLFDKTRIAYFLRECDGTVYCAEEDSVRHKELVDRGWTEITI